MRDTCIIRYKIIIHTFISIIVSRKYKFIKLRKIPIWIVVLYFSNV
nr:MAG TPA: hypothetical protein [Caudoviricetes sp.]